MGFLQSQSVKRNGLTPLSYKFAVCFLLKFFLLTINFRSKGDAIHGKEGERFEEIYFSRK
jgi:hypothetical protein